MVKKTYIYSITDRKKNRNYGGVKETAKIYRLKNNKPIYIGEKTWNTASHKGKDSEVYTELKDKKEVSKKEFDKNDGYFLDKKNSKIEIFRVG